MAVSPPPPSLPQVAPPQRPLVPRTSSSVGTVAASASGRFATRWTTVETLATSSRTRTAVSHMTSAGQSAATSCLNVTVTWSSQIKYFLVTE